MRTQLVFVFILFAFFSHSQELYFPPLTGDEWASLPPEELGWCSEKVDSLVAFLEEKNTKAFIILKDGKLVVEEYFGTYTKDSSWYWASAGKSLMGVMMGLAQEDGHLNIEDKTSDYLGEGWTSCNSEEENRIRLRHQLSMASGLDDSVEPPGSTANCFIPECFSCLAEPDTRWAYHNSAYRILQDVLEEATGTNKNVYTLSRLGNRIGMSGLWFNYIFFSKARSMARFGLFILAEGRWEEDIIMADNDYFNSMLNPSQYANPSYGYLWWLNGQSSYQLPGLQFSFDGSLLPEAPSDLFAALGANDQKIYVVPSLGLVVVRQGESAGGVSPASSSFDNQLWERLMDLECVTPTTKIIDPHPLIEVFPNPVEEMASVTSSNTMLQLQLFDGNGRLIKELVPANSSVHRLNFQGLPGGVYWLRVAMEEAVVVKRVVVKNG